MPERAEKRPIRLGHRQVAVLRSAAAGEAATHHSGQGRMVVFVKGRDPLPDSVLGRLLDLGLVALGERTVAGHKLTLTEAGRVVWEAHDA